LQVVELDAQKTPFEIARPTEVDASVSSPPFFSIRTKRDSRATRNFWVEWTGEVTADGEGYRVLGAGREGTLRIPRNLAPSFPSNMIVRVYIVNGLGKAYEIDKVYRLGP